MRPFKILQKYFKNLLKKTLLFNNDALL
ncbi:hypothetical protein [Salmonella phage SilasIsHot]|nr:hypothetical protein [Salmonella phage SilasIsHot]